MWRQRRDALFAQHPDSPLPTAARRDFRGLSYQPYDPALRFEATVSAAPPQRREVPTGTDGVVRFDRIGRVELPGVGPLDVWWLGGYSGGLFVPLRDATSGKTSYGGGRYLLDTVKGADLGGAGDRLVIDLNFAYNPSCAYDPTWACPLPADGNTVPVPVTAGELTPAE